MGRLGRSLSRQWQGESVTLEFDQWHLMRIFLRIQVTLTSSARGS